jgi:hypothetical protein
MNPIKKLCREIENDEILFCGYPIRRKRTFDYIKTGLNLGMSITKICQILANKLNINVDTVRRKYYYWIKKEKNK